jgi:hypothetical protein
MPDAFTMAAVARIERRFSDVSYSMSAPRTLTRREGQGPWGARVLAGLLTQLMCRRRGKLATGANPELAVDVARVGTDRLDTHPQGESDLCV